MAEKIVIFIEHDDCSENPCDQDGWRVYSFNRRHYNFKHPDEFDDDESLARKLKSGLAFRLSYFEHGNCLWTLANELPAAARCPFDSVGYAGLLVWVDAEKNLGPQTYEARREDARSFIETYTSWCNGEVYGYRAVEVRDCPSCCQEEVTDEHLDSCWGFIGAENLCAGIHESLGDGPFEFRGRALGDFESLWEDYLSKLERSGAE